MVEQGKETEEIAVSLYHLRIEIRAKYQLVTPTKEREEIYQRNISLYGDRLGPTLEYLRTVKGYSFEKIIEKAMIPDSVTNKKYGIK
jgi:hypothetical protein